MKTKQEYIKEKGSTIESLGGHKSLPFIVPKNMTYELPKSVSPSSLSEFENCPLKFKYKYIDKFRELPSSILLTGTMVHEALEYLYQNVTNPVDRTEENLKNIFRNIYVKKKEKGDFQDLDFLDSIEQQQEFGLHALFLLSNYMKMEKPDTIFPKYLEARMSVDLGGGLNLTGVVDRIDVNPKTGEYLIIDYKTGKAPVLKYNADMNRKILSGKFFQLRIYAVLLERQYSINADHMSLFFLGSRSRLNHPVKREELEEVEEKIRTLWQQIQIAYASKNFEPKVSKLCDWCVFKSICPAWNLGNEIRD